MGKVVAEATVSLDGYVAGPNESGFEHLFAWFAGGDFEFPSSDPDFKVRLTEPDYRYMRDVVEGIGVLVIGRRMFDLNSHSAMELLTVRSAYSALSQIRQAPRWG